jgi:YidC/Oxa1 family membrane protein insertase
MSRNLPNLLAFAVLFAGLTAGWYYLAPKPVPPPPPPPPRPAAELIGALAGGAATDGLRPLPPPPRPTGLELAAAVAGAAAPPLAAPPKAPLGPVELIPLGDDSFFNKLLLTSRGGAVQQVTLTRFEEADRLGRDVKRDDGSKQPLRLIPGVRRPRDRQSLATEAPFPDLQPGPVADPGVLSEPSYVLLHYPAVGDPLRKSPADADFPSAELGTRTWQVVEQTRTPDRHTVVFETTLDAPYFLTLRKTFTLAPGDYHVGFTLGVTPRPGREKDKGEFRYQLVAGRGLPVEGEWYTQAYRTALVGWRNPAGAARRAVDDAATIHHQHGGESIPKGENTFTYAGVGTQYFAATIAVDDTATGSASSPWERVRPTREPHPWDDPDHLMLADITVRAVAKPLNLGPTDAVTHSYLLYNGPVKVKLLGQLAGDRAVDPALVARYLDGLTLRTLSDYHSPFVWGRFANFLYWTDLVLASTNLMHDLLRWLHGLVPNWGLNILMLTMLVRLALFPLSRRQQAMAIRQQELMGRLKPELDKLADKFKDDPQGLNAAKTQLMLKNGMNPLAMSGGCLLLFFQMPVFMGLYFCLQESIFFRNEPFLWFPNLAAPDMLLWWGEKVPWFTTLANLGYAQYLGPYLNLLPIVGVVLIFVQQQLAMPPAMSEEQAQQQKVMKYMVVLMAVFFYRVPSGLSLYFIVSTTWALTERQFIPKPKPKPLPAPEPEGKAGSAAAPAGGGGFLARLKAQADARMKELQEQADQQSKRQIRNEPRPDRGGKKKKKW